MKTKAVLMPMVAAVVFLAAAFAFAGEKPWFDMQNCEFCKSFAKDTHLMENVAWENHKIAHGLLVVTTVKPEYTKTYEAAKAEMMAVFSRIEKGEKIQMCGHCEFYGKLHQSSANFEEIKTNSSEITLITSAEPKVLAMIHEFGDNNKAEMAKMEAAKAKEAKY